MKKRTPHCSHVSHYLKCLCSHEKQVHADIPEENRLESGRCGVRRCQCEMFEPQPGYSPAQLEHEMVPIGGYADSESVQRARAVEERRGEKSVYGR